MYFNLNIENIEKHRQEAIEAAVSAYGADVEGELLFPNAESEIQDFRISDNRITFNAKVTHRGDEIGSCEIDIPLDMDDIAQLISEYVKKANKIKTLLEASK